MNKLSNLALLQARMSPEARAEFVKMTQEFLHDEYDIQVGNFDVEEILSFFCKTIAPMFYNQGVEDARTMVEKRFAEIGEDIAQLQIIES